MKKIMLMLALCLITTMAYANPFTLLNTHSPLVCVDKTSKQVVLEVDGRNTRIARVLNDGSYVFTRGNNTFRTDRQFKQPTNSVCVIKQ